MKGRISNSLDAGAKVPEEFVDDNEGNTVVFRQTYVDEDEDDESFLPTPDQFVLMNVRKHPMFKALWTSSDDGNQWYGWSEDGIK